MTENLMKLKRKLLIMTMIKGFNKLTTEKFAARLAKVNLETKSDISFFHKRRYFDDKLKNLNK